MEPNILFEDNFIFVIDKPARLIVHNGEQSVAGWLQSCDPSISKLPWPDPGRAGIVHRLDQESSGVMVLAKTPDVLANLQGQFHSHSIKKIYWAIVYGHPDPEQGSVDVAIGRHRGRKTPMAVVPVEELARGKVREASTDYHVLEKFKDAALVEATLHTGRTHQIRLHMKYLGHPILGDGTYGTKPSRRLSKSLGVDRQMLHAKVLGFQHPVREKWMQFETLVPTDFQGIIDQLKLQS